MKTKRVENNDSNFFKDRKKQIKKKNHDKRFNFA